MRVAESLRTLEEHLIKQESQRYVRNWKARVPELVTLVSPSGGYASRTERESGGRAVDSCVTGSVERGTCTVTPSVS